jgi:hypothetical protein
MVDAGGWGTVTVGRIALRETFKISETGGDVPKLSLAGQESMPPLTRQQLVDRHGDLLALEGCVLPVTFEDKAERNGYYLVSSVAADLTEYRAEMLLCDWKIELERAGSGNETDLQSRLTGAVRINDFSLTGERWHAPSIGHYGYYTGSSSPTSMTRSGEDGTITVYRSVPSGVSPRWGCDPTAYMQGRVRMISSNSREVTGTDRVLSPTGWTLSNGLVSVQPGTGAALNIRAYTGGAWRSKQWAISAGTTITSWDSVSVLHNEPEQVLIRLVKSTSPGRVTLDLGIRRGSRIVEGYLRTGSSATASVFLLNSENYTAPASAGYVVASGDDADGNQFVIGSARNFTAHASGGITKASTTSLDFFAGVVNGGTNGNVVDGTFETGVSGWVPNSSTFVQSNEQAHRGTYSGKLTVTGTPVQAYVRPTSGNHVPVVAGQQYRLTFWTYLPVAYASVATGIDWQDASSVYLSTSSNATAAASGQWIFRDYTVTAPANAAYAVYGPTLGTNPPTGTVLYLDDLMFRPALASGDAATDLRNQYIASLPEAVYPVRR